MINLILFQLLKYFKYNQSHFHFDNLIIYFNILNLNQQVVNIKNYYLFQTKIYYFHVINVLYQNL